MRNRWTLSWSGHYPNPRTGTAMPVNAMNEAWEQCCHIRGRSDFLEAVADLIPAITSDVYERRSIYAAMVNRWTEWRGTV